MIFVNIITRTVSIVIATTAVGLIIPMIIHFSLEPTFYIENVFCCKAVSKNA